MQFKFNIPIYNLDVTIVTIYDKYDAPELKKYGIQPNIRRYCI